jgi:hypothetical protein
MKEITVETSECNIGTKAMSHFFIGFIERIADDRLRREEIEND